MPIAQNNILYHFWISLIYKQILTDLIRLKDRVLDLLFYEIENS